MALLAGAAIIALSLAAPRVGRVPRVGGGGAATLLEEHFTWGPGRLQEGTSATGDTRAEASGGRYLLTTVGSGVPHVGSYAAFDEPASAVALAATVDVVSGRFTSVALGCMDRETGAGFLFGVTADLSRAVIWVFPPNGLFMPIAEWSGEPGEEVRSLQLECRAGESGTTRVTGSANGQVLVTSPESEGPTAYTGLVVDVLEPAAGAQVAFDDLLAREVGTG